MSACIKTCCSKSVWRNNLAFISHACCSSSISTHRHKGNSSTNNGISLNINEQKTIVVPKKKVKDDLSILKAIAATVKKDFSAPHYRYIDDPYLLPTSSGAKKAYSLAKASGQSAARFVIQTHPEVFKFDPSKPSIEVFLPKAEFTEADDALAGLQERIDAGKAVDTFHSYQKLKENETPVPVDVFQDLLDLLCAYNGEDRPEKLLPDEQFLNRDFTQQSGPPVKTWKSSGPAEQFFQDQSKPTMEMYNSLVRGRAKFQDVNRAYELYEEMKNQEIVVDVATYNSILGACVSLKSRSDLRWQLCKDVISDMANAGVRPDLGTFNSILSVLMRCSRFKECTKWTMEILNEMRQQGIDPSLGTWYRVLRIFYPTNDSKSKILWDIVKELEGREFIYHEPEDLEFFSVAMTKCHGNLEDLDLAYKIDSLLRFGANAALVGDGYREGLYYTMFLKLICMFEPMEKIIEEYERITPYTYTPTFNAMGTLLQAIELNEGYEYLPKLYTDTMLFDFTRRIDIMEELFRVMAKKRHSEKLQKNLIAVTESMRESIETFIERLTRNNDGNQPIMISSVNGALVGYMVDIALFGGDVEKAWQYFQVYLSNRNQMEKYPSEGALGKLSSCCMEDGHSFRTIKCLEVMADCAYPQTEELIEKAKEQLDLSEDDRSHLDSLLH